MAKKQTIEIRDPLHVFVKLKAAELPVLNCPAFQRLRHVHQLALSYLVYPGATHKRFEHSLGVMELATRIYNVVIDAEHLVDEVRDSDIVPTEAFDREYWRRVLRVAALCHDTGHLPFSHAAEKELLPEGANHETLTEQVVRSEQMLPIWDEMKLNPNDIVLLAIEPEDVGVLPPWQAILNEIITGASFGADRMDYLLRDSLHAGVAYGRFDHFRLIDTLRILPPAPLGDGGDGDGRGRDPELGIEHGGLESAEALILARYFMFSQVYLHRVRRIYDIHLKDFLQAWLPEGHFSVDLDAHLSMTDNEVLAEMQKAAKDEGHPGHVHARRIMFREHFKVLYTPTPDELATNDEAARQVFDAAVERYGLDQVRFDRYTKGAGSVEFPVLQSNGKSGSSMSVSDVLARVPEASTHHVFVAREVFDDARKWKDENLASLTEPRVEEEEEPDQGKEG